jgi:hypothetical protein
MQVKEKLEKNVDYTPQESGFEAQKKLVEELKGEWKLMWSERFNDKVRAEGVSVANYASLRVEQGTIIHATRDFKALDFKDILKQNMVEYPDRFIQPSPEVGGWNKFIKTKITNTPHKSKSVASETKVVKSAGQLSKKNGRGWLHTA